MSPDIIILLLGLVALMALGIPICFAMMSVASVILLVFYGSGLLNVLNAAFVYQMQSESLLAIPMFALMAAFLQTSGIGGDIYEFFHKWLGGINGGLAMATVATTAVIAAMSGVAATATIMMGLIALPAMLDRGYDKALATGPVLAGGCLGPIIPPSTIMIIMSSYTGVSARLAVCRRCVARRRLGPAVHHLYRHPLCHQSQAGPRHPQGRASLLGREDAGV